MKIFSGFDDVDERRKRRRKRKTKTKTKDENEDERRKRRSKKNSRKKKVNFQNKCVSSQNKQYEKRRGRHGRRLSAILFPTFSQRAVSSGRTGSVLPWMSPKQWETPLTTENVLLTKRRRFSDFKLNKKMQLSLTERSDL